MRSAMEILENTLLRSTFSLLDLLDDERNNKSIDGTSTLLERSPLWFLVVKVLVMDIYYDESYNQGKAKTIRNGKDCDWFTVLFRMSYASNISTDEDDTPFALFLTLHKKLDFKKSGIVLYIYIMIHTYMFIFLSSF